MKTRKPPYALVSILLVLIGVAVVMGGRMMALNSDTNSEEMAAAMKAKEEQEQQHTQLTPVKPGELRDAAKERSKPNMPDADIPKPKLGSAIPKVKNYPPPKPNETSNRSLRGY